MNNNFDDTPPKKADFLWLYQNICEGVCVHEVIYDNEGNAVDYRILDTNPAYEHLTQISKDQAVGSLASELYGTGAPPYLKEFSRVAETGNPETLETSSWNPYLSANAQASAMAGGNL